MGRIDAARRVHADRTLVVLDEFLPSVSRVCLAVDNQPTLCADLGADGMSLDRAMLLRRDKLYAFDEFDVREMKVGPSGWQPAAPVGEAGLPDPFSGKPREAEPPSQAFARTGSPS